MSDPKHSDPKHGDPKHGADTDAATDHPAPAPEAPPVQAYPKMLYHADGRQIGVPNADAEAAAHKDGFTAQPGGVPAPPTKAPR